MTTAAQRLCFSIVVVAAVLTGCPAPIDDQASTIRLSSSEGTSAELSVQDPSGFLLTARDGARPESASDFEIEAVPQSLDAVRVSWIASPCHRTPHLTVDGSSLSNLQVILDAGLAEDVECPSIGVVFSVILVFDGEVSVQEVTGRRVGE